MLTFGSLKVTPELPGFEPGPLRVAESAPDWNDYAPPEPGGLSRVFGGAARHERQTAEARAGFDAAVADHRHREARRQRAFSAARTSYERKIEEIRAGAAAQNAVIEARRTAFETGDPEAVEWFVSQVLDASHYPDGFPRQYQVAYRPENRDVVVEFDLKRFRFTDDMDVIADLDSRKNLLNLSPTEFEHLVRQLFVAMGAEAWTTIPSKDGGVDAVATSRNLFFGGVCLIQAKRWTGLVGLESVHALTGVMADHNATTGVLVTTSWFGRASEQFAQRNRITLINGAELKQLIKDHLKMDVIPGTSPPRRLRASNNTQTGRPGPGDSVGPGHGAN